MHILCIVFLYVRVPKSNFTVKSLCAEWEKVLMIAVNRRLRKWKKDNGESFNKKLVDCS